MDSKRTLLAALTLCAVPLVAEAAQGTIARGTIVSPLVGPNAASQLGNSMYSTDLGISTRMVIGTSQYIAFHFGDSWSDANGTPFPAAGSLHDDFIGFVSLATYPSGAYVDQNAGTATNLWQRTSPTLTMRKIGTTPKAIRVLFKSGSSWVDASLEAGKTPVAVFSTNDRTIGGVAYPRQTFGIFTRYEATKCSTAADCGGGSMTCDTQMGLEQIATSTLYRPCVGNVAPFTAPWAGYSVTVYDENLLGHTCQPVQNFDSTKSGLCRDTTSPMIGGSAGGAYDDKVLSTAFTYYVGVQGPDDTSGFDNYYSKKWVTSRFQNLTARSVWSWQPGVNPDTDSLANFQLADTYNTASYTSQYGEKVLLFGRPSFVSKTGGGRNRRSLLYAAYAELPRANATTYDFTWAPKFLASTSDASYPSASWSTVETDAVPLANTTAPTDNTNQLDLAYDPSFQRWLMIQGGDNPNAFLMASVLWPTNVVRNTQNAIVAKDSVGKSPWAWPTTAFTNVVVAGDPAPGANNAAGSTMYGKGGILHHANCMDTVNCVAATQGTTNIETPFNLVNPSMGRLYGAHFIERWIQGDNSLGVNWHYFTVSTWNPYGVYVGKFSYKNP
jgi:hypothetical protein